MPVLCFQVQVDYSRAMFSLKVFSALVLLSLFVANFLASWGPPATPFWAAYLLPSTNWLNFLLWLSTFGILLYAPVIYVLVHSIRFIRDLSTPH